MGKRLAGLLLFGAILVGCKKPPVAQVGSIPITEDDLTRRMKVSEIYYPKNGQRYVALAQLIQSYLNEEVLKQLGYKVDQSTWEAESKRIDQNTKSPEQLQKIKDVYGLDHQGYIKTFIRPVYAERYLYNEVFLKSAEIQKEERAKADTFMREVQAAPDQFSKIAEKMGLKPGRLLVSEKEGIQPYEESKRKLPPAGRPAEPAGLEQAKFMIDKVKNLSPGQIDPEIIEWQEGYQALRMVGKEGEAYVIESVSVPKKDFSEWFWSSASKIPIKIVDPALKAELLKQVNWTSKLKME